MSLTIEPADAVNERWRAGGRLADVLQGEVKSRHHPIGARVAKVESLRITLEQWHTKLHPARQAAILAEAFGAEV